MTAARLRFLGTGNAFHADGRGSPGLLVEPAAGPAFLVDCGPTALPALRGAAIETATIARLFLTHLHGDHTAGWPFVLLDLVHRARRRDRFDVVGPPGTRAALEGLVRHCYPEVLDDPGFPLAVLEVPVADAPERSFGPALAAATWTVHHHPSSIAWRFRVGVPPHAGTLAVSGDTGWCPNLVSLAEGADLLVLECTSVEPEMPTHLSLAELRACAGTLRATRVLLVHLPDAVAEALARDPIARVEAASDGLTVDL